MYKKHWVGIRSDFNVDFQLFPNAIAISSNKTFCDNRHNIFHKTV